MPGRIGSNTIVWIVGAVIVIGLLGWSLTRILNPAVGFDSSVPSSGTTSGTDTASSTVAQPTKTYSNESYGFTISYPTGLRPRPFTAFHALPSSWRVNAPPGSRGIPIIAIPVLQIDSSAQKKNTYPLFFDTEVRVSVSDGVADCYAPDAGYDLQTIADVDIQGVTWKKFIFGTAATMQYLSGASYRTIHDNRCYVVEQVRTGSTYKDGTMPVTYSDEQLDAAYAETTPIVMSFTFTR